ncbi:MAG: circadian clock KaiB family protein [Candidatus Brocadiia bacterium]
MNTSDKSSERTDAQKDQDYVVRLYVAGEGPRSSRAIENLNRICREHMPDHYDIEIVDIVKNPDAAEEGNIVAVPTVIKKLPPPLRKVVGDLSQIEKVLVGLEIETEPEDNGDEDEA